MIRWLFVSTLAALVACSPAPRQANAPPASSPASADADAGATDASSPPAHPGAGALRVGRLAMMDLARFLNSVHNQIHPHFADEYIESLKSAPPEDPRNNRQLAFGVLFAIGANGQVVDASVVYSSGVARFDREGLAAILRGAPFGATPIATRSWDGVTYVRWDFYRDEAVLCATLSTHPFRFLDEGEKAAVVARLQKIPPQPVPANVHHGANVPQPAPGDTQL